MALEPKGMGFDCIDTEANSLPVGGIVSRGTQTCFLALFRCENEVLTMSHLQEDLKTSFKLERSICYEDMGNHACAYLLSLAVSCDETPFSPARYVTSSLQVEGPLLARQKLSVPRSPDVLHPRAYITSALARRRKGDRCMIYCTSISQPALETEQRRGTGTGGTGRT